MFARPMLINNECLKAYVHSYVLLCTVCTIAGGVIILIAILFLFRAWMQGGTCRSSARLDGKTVVITGCNTGIGKITAIDLSKRGAKIVMLCRSVEKAEAAAEDIRSEAKGEVVVLKMDLASLESITVCVEQLKNIVDKIDILINNAGVMQCPDLKIVNLSSIAHNRGAIHWDDINFNKTPYDSSKAYAQSKLANILFTKELARRLVGSSVTAYALHPGVVATELWRHMGDTNGCIGSLVAGFVSWLCKTPEAGAQTSIFCAVDESITDHSGRYYSDCKEKRPKTQAENMEDARRLWELSEQLTGIGKNKNF